MTETLPDGSLPADGRLVRAGEYRVVTDGATLVAYGLGASVGVAFCGPDSTGGLAHALLPQAERAPHRSSGTCIETAIQETLRELIGAGVGYGSIRAKLVGGATIFQLAGLDTDTGRRTVTAARKALADVDVPVVETDVGGSHGRTVAFDTTTDELVVYTCHDSPTTM